jgi:AcrR family transcriptional regulator
LAPKVKFTREDVVLAAFDLVKEGGLKNLTALKVAQRLKSSVKPIYTHHQSMDNLKRDVFNRIIALMRKYIQHDYQVSLVINNIAIGQLIFVWNFRNLYLALFSEQDEKFQDIIDAFTTASFESILADPILAKEPKGKIFGMYVHMSHYEYGLCMAIANRWYDHGDFSLDDLIRAVNKAANMIYQGVFDLEIMGAVPAIDPFKVKYDYSDISELENQGETIPVLEHAAINAIEA